MLHSAGFPLLAAFEACPGRYNVAASDCLLLQVVCPEAREDLLVQIRHRHSGERTHSPAVLLSLSAFPALAAICLNMGYVSLKGTDSCSCWLQDSTPRGVIEVQLIDA